MKRFLPESRMSGSHRAVWTVESACKMVRYTAASVACAAAMLLCTPGCERVSYYSYTGSGPEESTGTGTPTQTVTPTITRAAVLGAVGTCASSLYSQVAAASKTLQETGAEAAADPTKVDAARDAWRAAIDLWQQAEVIRIGPAGPASSPGGQDKRDLIYSWPLVSRCLLEQTLVSKGYEAGDFFSTALVNMRGLAASEYLLFYTGADNACSSATSINSTGTWAALSETELSTRKRAYAARVAVDIATQTKAVADAWSTSGGNFQAQLATAGESGSAFSTDRLAMNLVSDGLFYLDTDTKDLKLGKPLGIVECADATCPEAVESKYAFRSRTHVKNNLLGFRRVYEGCSEANDLGFDDLIAALGKGDLAAQMSKDLELAIAAADALPNDDVAQSMLLDKAKVLALHAAIKKLTDAMKTEFVTVLDLELPQTVEGDND
ncbi:MAG: imelysin family protein [Polyangiaceae bacterium]|nr:imelysin family protein [Polyangiaceae bacterium]